MQTKINKRLFIAYSCFVFLPLLVIILYLTIVAQDRYKSSSIILVKQVSDSVVPDTTGLTALLGVPNTSAEDSQILKKYIVSRDMVEKLDHQLNIRKEFNGVKDPIFALKKDATIEELVEYFNKVVQIDLDEKTMMLEVSSQGFSPEFSLKLNQEILKQSDAFINDISLNIALEQQTFAEKQLVESTLQLKQARDTLLDYQNKNEIFDPELQAKAVATLIAGLQANIAQLRTEERTLLSYLTSEAPQVVAIKSQIESVEKQIEAESAKLTSPNNAKLNKNVADFEELKAQVTFATDLYKLSLTSLEKARLEASRKLKKLVVISKPRLAQDALYPRKIYLSITSFILLNILFGIGLLIHSIVREHRE
ncbi:capsule biosynthesis protein [Acinetobacter shaoyimingii]|uniref:Capsule biosynthesis protein n=1 Tax=Acinetobacter shaoyimingii TaxID=2715164 RepID=A0A6G8RRW1_9GAMM|nr:capsule biosynthesis protein [Acinetobacter shaoyimingii]QIO04560.1 capsule biosynthesis protein [Acinetobacter shaoyimingii]